MEILENSLFQSIKSSCKGNTGVTGPLANEFLDHVKISARRAKLSLLDAAPENIYDTVLMIGNSHASNKEGLAEKLSELSRTLSESGRLIVCVENDDVSNSDFAVKRKDLSRQLKHFGSPKTLATQPYFWVAMYVDRQELVPKSVARRYQVFADLCKGRVLELGSGAGHLAGEIASRGHSVTGVERNKAKSELSKKLYPDVQFLNGNILALPTELSQFDTVILPEVIEHVEAEVGLEMLDIAWNLVAPGGRFVVSVPNEDLVPHKNHLTEFNFLELKDLLSKFGEPVPCFRQPFKWLLMYVDKPT